MLHSHKPYRLLSDERLARLAAARDDRAFSALYQRHESALLGYCRSITRDSEDARDALQSAMAAAYSAVSGRGSGTGPVRGWLFRIAHNESVNVLRRRRGDVPLADTDLAPAPSAADETSRRETAHEALADVAQLPPRQRGALVLRELHGLGYEEIAAALSVTEINARQLVFAARSGVADSRAGRDLPCELVRDTIEAGDRRAQRRRPLRAHLRSCDDCRAYARVSHGRPRRAILALPGGWLAGWAPFANGGAASLSTAGELMAPAKTAAVVAVVAAVAGGAAHESRQEPVARAAPRVAEATPRASAPARIASVAAAPASSAPARSKAVTRARVVPALQRRPNPSRRAAATPAPVARERRHRDSAGGRRRSSAWRDGWHSRGGSERSVRRQAREGDGGWRSGGHRDSGWGGESPDADSRQAEDQLEAPDQPAGADQIQAADQPEPDYALQPDATSDTPGSSSPAGVS